MYRWCYHWVEKSLQLKLTRFSDNKILCILKLDGLIWNRSFNNRHYNTAVSRLPNCVPRGNQLPPTQFQTAARAVSNCGPRSFKLRLAYFPTAWRVRFAQFPTGRAVDGRWMAGARPRSCHALRVPHICGRGSKRVNSQRLVFLVSFLRL